MNNVNTPNLIEQLGRPLKGRIAASLGTVPKLWNAERKLLLAFGDILIICTALAISLALQNSFSSIPKLLPQLHWFLLVVMLWGSASLVFDTYHPTIAASPMRSIWAAASTALSISVLFFIIPFVTPPLPDRRLAFLFFPLLMVIGIGIWRFLYAKAIAQRTYHESIVIIGAGWAGRTLAKTLFSPPYAKKSQFSPNVGYQIVGFVDDDPTLGQMVGDISVLGSAKNLTELVQQHKPDQIALAITHSDRIQPEMFQAILECRTLGVPIISMAELYEKNTGKIPLEQASHNLGAILSTAEPGFGRLYRMLMRLITILIGLQGCILTAMLIPFIWLLNLRGGRGPIFYYQERVGKAGELFQIIKFRSMIVDAEKLSGAVWADDDDPRITPAGRFLRKTRLDEIPQFWNILKGDMSLIGPRPERPNFVDLLSEEFPLYPTRHAVRPGLTGWAQVMYRYGASVEDAGIKLQYDLFYIKHRSLYLDLKILLKTIGVVVGLQGR